MATYYDYEENEKRGGGFFKKLLAVFLGFLFGIIATIGSLAAIGYFLFAKIKIKEGFSAVNDIAGTNINYTEYITDEYAEKTISELLKDLASLASEFQDGTGSLSSLNKISPQVETQITKIADTLRTDYNIPLLVNSPNKDAEGNILDEANNVVIDKNGAVVKKDANGNAILTSDDGDMLVGLMDVPFGQLASFVSGTVEPIELGSVLGSKKLDMLRQGTDNYDLIMLLCYGDKTNYETDANGDVLRDEDGKAVMKNGAKATTVGDFLSGESGEGESGGIVSLLEKISVAGILDATDSLDESNALVRALLYETDVYTLDAATNEFTAPDGTKYTYDAQTKQWTNEKGDSIKSVTSPIKAASFSYAASTSDSAYVYRVYDKNGKLICSLAPSQENGTFEAYDENDELKTSPRSLKSFMNALGGEGGDVTDLLSDVQLGLLLGLDEKTYGDDTKMLYALAYGSLGSDFKIETDTNGKEKVVMLDGAKPATVGDLLDGDTDALFDKISLDSIMSIKRTDNVICALAYGTEGKQYSWAESAAEPTMLPVRYTLKADGLYNDNDEKAQATLDEATGVYTVVVSKSNEENKTFYAKRESAESSTYFLYKTADCTGEKVLYQKTTLGDLLSGPNDLLNDIELGSLMGLTADSDKILLALAYGTEGTDYEIVVNSGEKSIVFLDGGKKPATVGELTNNAGDLLNDIQLGSVLGISPLDKYDEDDSNDPDSLMLALAYGEEGVDYEIVKENGKNVIRWLNDSKPRTIKDLQNGDILDDVQLSSVLGISPLDKYDEDASNDPDPLMLALAYGEEGINYEVVNEDGKYVLRWLNGSKPRTIKDLQSDDIFDDIRLSSVLGVSPLDADSDKLMTALAYGNEGQHYKIENEKIVWLTDSATGKPYAPRTISDLKKGSAVIDDLYLSTVLDVNPASGKIMLALAYGNENEDYEIVGDEIRMLGNAKPRTISELKQGDLIESVRLSSVFASPDTKDKITMYLLYGVEGTHYRYDESTNKVEMLNKEIGVLNNIAYDERGTALPGTVQAAGESESFTYTYTHNAVVQLLTTASGKTKEIEIEGEKRTIVYYYVTNETGANLFYQPRTIGDLSGDSALVSNVTKDLTLGELVGDTGDSKLLAAISEWKIDDLNDQNKIMDLKISDVIAIDDGSTGILKAIKQNDWTLNDLNDQNKIMGLKIADVITIDDDSTGILKAIEQNDWTLNDLNNQNKIMSLKMSDVMVVDDSSPSILQAMKEWTLDDLNDQNSINSLKLIDILDKTQVESNTILKHLQNSTVATLANDLENLKLQKVFENDVYKTQTDGTGESAVTYFIDENDQRLYENPVDGKFYTTEDFQSSTQSTRVLTGTWKYLLTDTTTGTEGDYTITDMDRLVSNMTANIQNATLNDLYNDGIISLSDTSFLTNEVKYEFTFTYMSNHISIGSVKTKYYRNGIENEDNLKTKVGELTITELLNYVGEVIELF